ncbi:hypothetical protein PM082_020458 [Marasmius tenuissimus]|nr:hypothetical protein PM082_020458 [Marasmius tenuissimus]
MPLFLSSLDSVSPDTLDLFVEIHPSLRVQRLTVAHIMATLFIVAISALLAKHFEPPAAGIYSVYQIMNVLCLQIDRIPDEVLHYLWTFTMPISITATAVLPSLRSMILVATLSAVHHVAYPLLLRFVKNRRVLPPGSC